IRAPRRDPMSLRLMRQSPERRGRKRRHLRRGSWIQSARDIGSRPPDFHAELKPHGLPRRVQTSFGSNRMRSAEQNPVVPRGTKTGNRFHTLSSVGGISEVADGEPTAAYKRNIPGPESRAALERGPLQVKLIISTRRTS